ncbi:hypothetical protein JCM12298_17230 [Desulfothermus naphthae]
MNNKNMLIRQVKFEDIENFVETYMKAYEDFDDYKYHTKKEIRKYFKWLYNRDKEGFFVAEEGDKIVGFVAADANWINLKGEKILEIHEIFVLKEFKRKGVGDKLLEKVLNYGIKQGRKAVELWVGRTNYDAINFYKKLGFKKIGEKGKWLKMRRSLICCEN